VTELYVVTTVNCPHCGQKVDGYNWNREHRTHSIDSREINVGKYEAPHNTPYCGQTMAEHTVEAFDVPEGCLFGWDEKGM
jgi:hypothetical protein